MFGRTLRSLVVVGLVGLSAVAHAAITVYTDQMAFLSAISAPGVDTFAGFLITGPTPSPIVRTAGPYGYTAAASGGSFFGAGTTANPWLSTNTATDSITFNTFTGGVRGIGGNFFGSNVSGAFVAGNLTLAATDSLGATSTQTITGATVSSFLGFVSTGSMTSLVLTAVQPGAGFLWPTVDNLTMGTIVATPAVLISAVSRKVHGGAVTFDMPLTLTPLNNPSTEPRQGPTATVVLTFDKAIASATATITQGTASLGLTSFVGADVIVGLTGVSDQQYVTVTLTNVTGVDGSTGGTGVVRIGFLLGDVNQSRVVTVSDLGQVNGQLAQPVGATNYLKDVNVSGTLTLTDMGITNTNLTHALGPP